MNCPDAHAHHLLHAVFAQIRVLKDVARQCANANAQGDLTLIITQLAAIAPSLDFKGDDGEFGERHFVHPTPCPFE